LQTQHIVHTFDPVYNTKSRVLILGTIPSPQSRSAAFYYGHRQNRFWTILSAVFKEEIKTSISGKKRFLLKHRIALWDVLAECNISGAADASISNPVPQDFSTLFSKAAIQAVLTTGKTAYSLYNRFCSAYAAPCLYLPSPSPANCAMSLARLTSAYKLLLKFCP
jgi:hypoxanthine-DNA glycosylase